MGKRLIVQRRGRGSTTYKSNSHRYKAELKYKPFNKEEKLTQGTVIDLINCPGHTAPLAKVKFNDGTIQYTSASLNIKINSIIESGENAKPHPGNTLPLRNIPEGSNIFNIENIPGDGGKFCRTSGTSGKLLKVFEDQVLIQLPSKKQKKLSPFCRATIGIIAGGGRTEKPIAKAGKRWHMMHARGKLYPRTSGVAMNAVDHPFGSGRGRQHSKVKVCSRHAPPGRKAGAVSARRTGKKR